MYDPERSRSVVYEYAANGVPIRIKRGLNSYAPSCFPYTKDYCVGVIVPIVYQIVYNSVVCIDVDSQNLP